MFLASFVMICEFDRSLGPNTNLEAIMRKPGQETKKVRGIQ